MATVTVELALKPDSRRQRRRREKARALGLCAGCCTQVTTGSKRRCDACNSAAKARVARMRERRKKQHTNAVQVQEYEAKGEAALERFAYVEAATRFEQALVRSSSAEDEMRLCQKIGRALFYGARPDYATPWIERGLERCTTAGSLPRKLYLLTRLERQHWLEFRTTEALHCLKHAQEIEVCSAEGNIQLRRRLQLLVSNQLVALERYPEGERLLLQIAKPSRHHITARSLYCSAWGTLLAAQGNASYALLYFDRLVEVQKRRFSGQGLVAAIALRAHWALALGRLNIAHTSCETAVWVARERRMGWLVPANILRYADLLVTIGDYKNARHFFTDALTYDTDALILRVSKAEVGIRLALALDDRSLLESVLDDRVLESVLRSEQPQRIGRVSAAYAQAYLIRGQLRRVKNLIARAIPFLRHADHVGDLLALAARYGSSADAARAKQMLLERTHLPCHRVAEAYLALWEAQTALRRRENTAALNHATVAASAFARLGWKHQQLQALTLAALPSARLSPHTGTKQIPHLGDLHPPLTMRQQQVAELAIRGLTNSAIAESLAISEHTAEAHMTAILNRLGLRSRWELVHISK